MELKEYLQIIKKYKNLFTGLFIAVILIIFGFFYLRSVSYVSSLTLNISRIGSQNTDQFKYDDFYRLQADEKFAETIVQWLQDPRIVSDIYFGAGIESKNKSIKQLKKSLRAEKLSSQIVNVSFSSPDKINAEKLSRSIVNVVSETTKSLNENQKENTWFQINAQEPVIVKYSPDFKLVLLGSIFTGLFVAFFGILLRHYLE